VRLYRRHNGDNEKQHKNITAMAEKYKNRYRIQSHRLSGWNYSDNGCYFLTLVTQNRKCNLGKIVDNKMILSEFGKIVEKEWFKSFEIRDELFLDAYITMPNHLHTIVILKKPNVNDTNNDDVGGIKNNNLDDGNKKIDGSKKSYFYRLPKSISSFIGGFKSSVNSRIDDFIDEHKLKIPKYNRHNHFFQPNYHDHIIRNEKSHQNISNYIINNPKKWDEDKFNPKNPQ